MSSRVSSIKRIASIAVFLLILVGGMATALAQNKQDGCLKDPICKDHYNKALKLYYDGKYADALPKFEDAYARRQMPWLMLNIGRTMQRLGRPQEAITYYERYKKAELNLDPVTLERVNKYIEQAKALLEKPPEPTENPVQRPVRLDPAQTTPVNPPIVQSPGTTPDGPKDVPAKKPIYKKWWFWTIIGVVVVGGVAGGVAGGLQAKKSPPPDLIPSTDPVYMPTF
jgi:hypothetical protein